MAEEAQPAPPAATQALTAPPPAEEAPPATKEVKVEELEPASTKEVEVPKAEVAEDPKPEAETPPEASPESKAVEESIPQSVSFKEESTRVADLEDPEKKALEELKTLIDQALKENGLSTPPPPPPPPPKEQEKPAPPKGEEKPAPEKEAEKEEEKPAEKEEQKPAASSAVEAPAEPEVEKPKPAEPTAAEITPEAPAAPETTPPSKAEDVPAPASEAPPAVSVETAAAPPAAPAAEDDGAKTVEAIEETVVPSASAPAAEAPETEAPVVTEEPAQEAQVTPEEVFIWGIPLLGDERSDVVLLKFLRARDFKVKDAFTMIKNTVQWRKSFEIEGLLEEDLGSDLESVVFMNGVDREGHPVCYNVYGEFQNKEIYQKTFADEEKRQRFLRWRIQFLEKGIRQLDFTPGGISTLVQVTDLKNSPGPGKRELRQATNQALSLLQDNYPEFVAKQVFINVPWWYLAFNRMISPFLTQRTKSKFVFAGPSKSTETLFKYIAPEQVPVQYGGLSKENDTEFSTADAATEFTIKPASKNTVEIPVTEACILVWELRILGWDVSYGAEFVPSAEDGYTVIVQKARKIAITDEPVIRNSFKIGEPGKIVLTVDNTSSKKKKLIYRYKTKKTVDISV
ncbi:hypothetical protein AMTRI_Chr11g154590 [Amborella trichopoda]|uniref:CRAL-TRIO domain-containing protein n=1 Tax=Amborella trichopoda TaxID=13333 RepID=U5D4U9_AMBTC|nr:patellin-3 [Amborella trichopoda]ERN20616.1 hypothetical protein AMTR_s00070p00121170 [Amborella trichopoda]|eukprot:XP_006859149.1 patellin-3 [Amborella trichopoda]